MKNKVLFLTVALALVPFAMQAQNFGSSDPSPVYHCGTYQWPTDSSQTLAVQIKQKYDHTPSAQYQSHGWDTTVTLEAPVIELSCMPYTPVQYFNGGYYVDQIPYNPPDTSFWLNGQGAAYSFTGDDRFTTSVNIPFPFYFFGLQKTSFRVGENGLITFDTTSISNYCPYQLNPSNSLPWTQSSGNTPGGNTYFNSMHDAIYGIYQDVYGGSNGAYLSGNQGLYYGIIGEYPHRMIIATWNDIPAYNDASKRQSYQIVCYEGTNIIEVHVKQRISNPNFNNGLGIIGIQNATGELQTQGSLGSTNCYVQSGSPAAFWPTGMNCFTTNLSYIAYRFTPQGHTQRTYYWYRIFDDGRPNDTLSTDPNDTNGYCIYMNYNDSCPTLTRAIVSPTVPSKYVFALNFKDANNNWYHLTDTISVGVDTILHVNVTANSSDSAMGTVSGSGTYNQFSTVTLSAMPRKDHTFLGWDNGAEDNPYSIIALRDTTVTALFAPCVSDTIVIQDTIIIHDTIYINNEGIIEGQPFEAKIYAADGQIVVETNAVGTVSIYDAVGRMMGSRNTHTGMTETILFDVPASGTYLVKIGQLPARQILILK